TVEGIAVRPIEHAWLNRQPRLVPWDRVQGLNQVITRQGGHLKIAAGSQILKLHRALFRADTFANLSAALAQRTRQWGAASYDEELAAACVAESLTAVIDLRRVHSLPIAAITGLQCGAIAVPRVLYI